MRSPEEPGVPEARRAGLFQAIVELSSQLARRGIDLRAFKSTARAMTAGRERASLEDLRTARSELRILLKKLERQRRFTEQQMVGMRQQIFTAAFLALFGGVALDRMLEEEPQNEDVIASTAEDAVPDEAPVAENHPPVTFAPQRMLPPPVASAPPSPLPREYFSFTPQELARLKNYAGSFRLEEHTDQQISRTFAGRLDDHIILLRDISAHFFNGNSQPFFIDIGPGVANPQSPAITSVEMARAFPNMRVMALDLPEEVLKFKTQVSQRKKDALARTRNLTIVSGDGLKSLRNQIPALPNGAPLVIRTANAIDIYCDWKDVEPVLIRMAEDFRDHPVLLLFNREILWKPRGEVAWKNIGQVSDRGFRHNDRNLRRNGAPYYLLSRSINFSSRE